MKYRDFGKSTLSVSEISLGTWAFASSVYGQVDEKEAIRTIHEAMEVGINLFDTAPLYGNDNVDGISETILGKALKRKRDSVYISTKFGRKATNGVDTFFDKKGVIQSVEESLNRLQTERIDILFFHSPFGVDQIHDDVWEGLEQLKAQGKLNIIGHSISLFEDTQQMARDWAAENKIQSIQVVSNVINRESKELITDLGQRGVGVVARECLANGFLTDAVDEDTVFPEGSINTRYSREEVFERVNHIKQFDFLRNDQVKTRAQVAMNWVLSNPHVSTVLTGASNREQLLDCAAASDAPVFTEEEMKQAEELHTKDYAAA